ncbi:MAG: TrkA family potassium uptake protein [Flaviflexus sp.]|uniref:potassium channel family protein n=1 Tax=Flaviflexus sp. TaxID=1969482 RepID=UPI00352D4698
MHYVIMGCGRVGASLAVELSNRGHSVSIIDQDSEAFRRLPDSFEGQQVTGVGFDREALEEAGIAEAAGFAAVSSGDNSNIIAARVVRETFGVSNVVARIYDPERAAIYERFGVPTVPTVSWTTDQVIRRLIPLPAQVELRNSTAELSIYHVQLGTPWLGRSVAELENLLPLRVAFLIRGGEGVIPRYDTVLQEGDEVRVVAAPTNIRQIEAVLAEGPREESE